MAQPQYVNGFITNDGATASFSSSLNITSVSRLGKGRVKINFAITMPDANYIAIPNSQHPGINVYVNTVDRNTDYCIVTSDWDVDFWFTAVYMQFDPVEPVNYIDGFNLSPNSTNPTYQFDILTGTCVDDAEQYTIKTLATKTVDITQSGLNGLDTGSEAANTWYYVFIVYNPTTTDCGVLLSTSLLSPTLPSGYISKRYIGTIRNDSSSDLIPYVSRGRGKSRGYSYISSIFSRQVLSNGNAVALPATAIDLSAFVPPTTQNCAIFVNQAGQRLVYMYTGISGAVIAQVIQGGTNSLDTFPTDTSQVIGYRNVGGGGGQFNVYVRGYTESV